MRTTGVRCKVESEYDVQHEIDVEINILEKQLKHIDNGIGNGIKLNKNKRLIVVALIERLTEELKK
jgi:hypothetical protein